MWKGNLSVTYVSMWTTYITGHRVDQYIARLSDIQGLSQIKEVFRHHGNIRAKLPCCTFTAKLDAKVGMI